MCIRDRGCIIDTIENYDKRIPIARNNFKRAGKEDCIRLIEGDAMEVLKELEGPYDFIFMDAAKGQYLSLIHILSERTVGSTFDKIFNDNKNSRIIIATFASNVDRVQQIINAAVAYGRKVCVEGRSIDVYKRQVIRCAKKTAFQVCFLEHGHLMRYE